MFIKSQINAMNIEVVLVSSFVKCQLEPTFNLWGAEKESQSNTKWTLAFATINPNAAYLGWWKRYPHF